LRLGCGFQAAAGEFPQFEHVSHKAARSHKEQVLRSFGQLAAEARLRNPQRLARQLLLLMDGASASARMFGASGPAAEVAEAAQALIDAKSGKNLHKPMKHKP